MGNTSNSNINSLDMEILYEEPGNGYIGLSYDPDLQGYILHITCNEWSVSAYKRYKKEIETKIREELKDRGITEAYGLSSTDKEVKFNKLWGAEPLGITVTTTDGLTHELVKGVI